MQAAVGSVMMENLLCSPIVMTVEQKQPGKVKKKKKSLCYLKVSEYVPFYQW